MGPEKTPDPDGYGVVRRFSGPTLSLKGHPVPRSYEGVVTMSTYTRGVDLVAKRPEVSEKDGIVIRFPESPLGRNAVCRFAPTRLSGESRLDR